MSIDQSHSTAFLSSVVSHPGPKGSVHFRDYHASMFPPTREIIASITHHYQSEIVSGTVSTFTDCFQTLCVCVWLGFMNTELSLL